MEPAFNHAKDDPKYNVFQVFNVNLSLGDPGSASSVETRNPPSLSLSCLADALNVAVDR